MKILIIEYWISLFTSKIANMASRESNLCTAALCIRWWLLVASDWASSETAFAQLEVLLGMGRKIWHKAGPETENVYKKLYVSALGKE